MAAGGAGMPLSMYSTPYSAETMAAYFPALGGDQPFYPNPVSIIILYVHTFHRRDQKTLLAFFKHVSTAKHTNFLETCLFFIRKNAHTFLCQFVG